MAYYHIAQLSNDSDFLQRCTACAVVENIAQAEQWVAVNRWRLAAAPGFSDAYASAVAGSVENPGRDEAVISDLQILSAVQTLSSAG